MRPDTIRRTPTRTQPPASTGVTCTDLPRPAHPCRGGLRLARWLLFLNQARSRSITLIVGPSGYHPRPEAHQNQLLLMGRGLKDAVAVSAPDRSVDIGEPQL